MKMKRDLMTGILMVSILLTGCGSAAGGGAEGTGDADTTEETEAVGTSGEAEETAGTDGTTETTATDNEASEEESVSEETDDPEPTTDPTESELFPDYSGMINMVRDYLDKMETPEDQRPQELTDLECLGGVLGIAEVLYDEDAYDELCFAAEDLNGDGIDEFFIIVNKDDRPYISNIYTIEDGVYDTVCAGWDDSRLYYLADGDFLRISNVEEEITTIEPEEVVSGYGDLYLGISNLYFSAKNAMGVVKSQ